MKNTNYTLHALLLIAFTFFVQVQEVMAGPGGKILKDLFDTPLGKVVGIVLTIILFPLILYVTIREYIEVKRTHKDLKKLALKHPKIFGWFNLKNRATEVFGQVHSAWGKEDMSKAKEWMTNWYWQNQQLLYLDKWESQGLVNVCNVKKILNIKPLHLNCSNEKDFEDSRVVVSIEANMEDYLMEKESGKVVEGKKGFKDGTTVWTLVLQDGQWKVENIEEDSMTLTYAKMKNELPALWGGDGPEVVVGKMD